VYCDTDRERSKHLGLNQRGGDATNPKETKRRHSRGIRITKELSPNLLYRGKGRRRALKSKKKGNEFKERD